MLAIVLGLSGCSLIREAGLADPQPTGPAVSGAAASPYAGSVDALPDPLHSDRNLVGEEVALRDAAVIYLGLSRNSGQIVARFRIVRGSLPSDVRIGTPEGDLVHLVPDGDLLTSRPFGDADNPPARDATVTLVIGEMLVPFEAGKLS